jgi:hypothetical protein
MLIQKCELHTGEGGADSTLVELSVCSPEHPWVSAVIDAQRRRRRELNVGRVLVLDRSTPCRIP